MIQLLILLQFLHNINISEIDHIGIFYQLSAQNYNSKLKKWGDLWNNFFLTFETFMNRESQQSETKSQQIEWFLLQLVINKTHF